MSHQNVVETSRVIHIAYASESTAVPMLPDRGDAISWSEEAGWTENDFAFSEDDFEYTPNEPNPIVVWPPGLEAPVGEINDHAGIESVRFTSYEIGKKILLWATNVQTVSGDGDIYEETAEHVRKALIIEYEGVGLRYFPSVEIRVEPESGGHRTLGKQSAVAKVFGTAGVPSGTRWHHYEPA